LFISENSSSSVFIILSIDFGLKGLHFLKIIVNGANFLISLLLWEETEKFRKIRGFGLVRSCNQEGQIETAAYTLSELLCPLSRICTAPELVRGQGTSWKTPLHTVSRTASVWQAPQSPPDQD